jgi:hypothetical protein
MDARVTTTKGIGTMRKGLATAVVLLLAGLGALHGADAHAAKKRSACDRPGTTTIKKQAGSRVFKQRRGSLVSTYACRYKTGKVFKLGTEALDDLNSASVELIRLAGVYVAWGAPGADDLSDWEDVIVMDLRTGSKRAPDSSETDGENIDVTDTALTPNGSFAWIVEITNVLTRTDVAEVFTLVGRKVTKVDTGTSKTIPGNSLAVEGNTLSWTNAGETKELTLP